MGIEASCFRWGQLEYLEHWQYFDILCTARSSVSILRVRICLCSRSSVLLACSHCHYSQYVGLLSTRIILAASTPTLSVLGLRFVLEYLSVKPLRYPEHQDTFILGGYAVSFSAGHEVLWRNLDLRQLFCTYVYAAYIELIALVICSGSISTYYRYPIYVAFLY